MTKLKYILAAVVISGLMMVAIVIGYDLAFRGLIYPRVSIAGLDVSGLDKESALKLVTARFVSSPSLISLTYEGEEVANLSGLKIEHDPVWAVEQAVRVGRNGNILTQIAEQGRSLFYGLSIDVPVKLDRDELLDTVEEVEMKVGHQPVWPKLVAEGNKIKMIPGVDGVEIKKDELTAEVLTKLSLPGRHPISIPTATVDTQADKERAARVMVAWEKWGQNKLSLHFREFEMKLSREEMLGLFGLVNEVVDRTNFELLLNKIKPLVEVEPQDAVFVFDNDKVNEFSPEVIGAKIDIPALYDRLAEELFVGEEKRLEIPAILTYPKVKAGDINNLGIKELIGVGRSKFAHSIPGRVFNVNLAASRVSGTLVPPGEEFSFVAAVGDITKATGYQTAYIISQGRTVLGDGGGVCQVSTTTFRAALDAGLPITERKAHAYRVGYYEQDGPPGIDATVYYPTADLKFLNDTGSYLLVQEEVDTKNLTMKVSLYGTSDGRKSSISKPRISNQSPPPPALYVDDPTLPSGTSKQIDWAAWGAKVVFDYTVERDGETIYEKTFVSNYQPWQAVYLKGTRQ